MELKRKIYALRARIDRTVHFYDWLPRCGFNEKDIVLVHPVEIDLARIYYNYAWLSTLHIVRLPVMGCKGQGPQYDNEVLEQINQNAFTAIRLYFYSKHPGEMMDIKWAETTEHEAFLRTLTTSIESSG